MKTQPPLLQSARVPYCESSENLQVVDFLSVDDPGASLALRVDQQRVPGRHGDDDAVLDGEFVVGQSLKVPLADSGVVDERRDQRQVDGVRDAALAQFALPRVEQLGAEFLVEWTGVRQEPRQQQNVPDQSVSQSTSNR